MRLLYTHSVNRGLRTLLRPVAPLLPDRWLFPVTGEITVAVGEGRRIRLACNPTSYVAKRLFWRGVRGFEYNQFRVFVALARRARVFVDVGANIGYYSLLAAAHNPALRVASFEPLPAAFHYLQANLDRNGCVHATPYRMALADASGTAQFFAARNPKFSGVAHHLTSTGALDARQAARSNQVETYDVEVETLDRFADTHLDAPIDLLKIDTEASEDRVLAGARRVLGEHRPVIFCEVLPGRIEQALERIFADHAYRLFRAGAAGLVPVDRLVHDRTTTNDHVMAPAEAVDALQPFLAP